MSKEKSLYPELKQVKYYNARVRITPRGRTRLDALERVGKSWVDIEDGDESYEVLILDEINCGGVEFQHTSDLYEFLEDQAVASGPDTAQTLTRLQKKGYIELEEV